MEIWVWLSLAFVVACMLLQGAAGRRVHAVYDKYDKVRNCAGISGRDASVRMLRTTCMTEVLVDRVEGDLSDHYDPRKNTVHLSARTYNSASIAAVAVAAHEIGHAAQRQEGYLPFRFRAAIVPVVNFGSRLAMPLVLIGVMLETAAVGYSNSDAGFTIALIGVGLFGLSVLFTLVTLPVEYNASRRAGQMLLSAGVLSEDELPAAEKVLSAAALTYLVAFLASVAYFARFLIYVLAIFAPRKSRR